MYIVKMSITAILLVQSNLWRISNCRLLFRIKTSVNEKSLRILLQSKIISDCFTDCFVIF